VAVPWPLTVRRLHDVSAGGSGSAREGIDTDLDRELAARGYRLESPTLVLTAAAREVAVATTPVGGASPSLVRVDAQPDDEWLATYHYRGQRLPAVARTLLLSAPRQVFASVRGERGRALAVARGASSRGWTGVTAMEVDPAHRRQGLARALLSRLSAWAVELGDESLYLQVAEGNAGARALYESVGFAPHHGYHYRVRD
jgi:GNAT superfamily N-acetyltransferase